MKKVYLFLVQTLMVLSLLFAAGCGTDDDPGGGGTTPGVNKQPTCTISNPQTGAQFNMDESISVTVVAEDSDGFISEVQLYIDDVGYSRKTEFPYNFVINAGELQPGTHTIKAVAKDDQGAVGEATVTISIKQPSTESPDFVSFSDGKIPNTWQTTAWEIDNTIGFDDIYSLKATESGVAVVTSKTFTAYSYIEFYTTGSNFYFYIDGVRVSSINSSNTGNWRQWVYAISPGTHTFKWESTSSDKLNLDAVKFAPSSSLPEIHTVEVMQHTGTSVTVSYTLSSNGNNATTHGVCWSVNPNPTVANNKTTNMESFPGNYTSIMENPIYNTTYYVRAYAVTGIGTVYGEELSITTFPKIVVGDQYQGGIVAYVDATDMHGLIAAPEDQSAGIQWHNGMYLSIGTLTYIGSGKSNTDRIVQMQGDGIYAAKICYDLVLNGYDDWFLPSKDEMEMLYQNRNIIGGFDLTARYWSSSEMNSYGAWFHGVGTGSSLMNDYYRENTYRVRAVRSF